MDSATKSWYLRNAADAARYTDSDSESRSVLAIWAAVDLCGFPHEEEEILPADELIENYKEKRAYLNKKIDDVLANIEKMLEVKV